MASADGAVHLVFNGEIYNFRELRHQLVGMGCSFTTSSDTEVVLHGYRQWGLGVFSRMNGMFAIAIWDVERQQLVLTRDRFGIKPLYFTKTPDALHFSSELRGLPQGATRSVDPEALHILLQYGYTPSPITMFAEVERLPAGHLLVANAEGVTVQRWYDIDATPFAHQPSDADAARRLLELYRSAARHQLVSDVPVGLLLSGGLDSGLLLALINEEEPSHATFSVGYGAAFAADELGQAAETARALGSPNFPTRLDRDEFEASLRKVIGIIEEPIASPSVVPMYLLSQAARRERKVVMMGQGVDELFGGYGRHLGTRYGRLYRGLPQAVRSLVDRGLGAAFAGKEIIRRGLDSLGEPDRLTRYQRVFSIRQPELVSAIFRDGAAGLAPHRRVLQAWSPFLPAVEQAPELEGLQVLELTTFLPDHLLLYADKLSMAWGLEVRVPYLDHEVVQFAVRLDSRFKIRRGERKWLHRKLCREFLPPRIVNRPKGNFGATVVRDWLRSSAESRFDQVLMSDDSHLYQYLNPATIRALLQAHKTGREDHHKFLYHLVVIEDWLQGLTSA